MEPKLAKIINLIATVSWSKANLRNENSANRVGHSSSNVANVELNIQAIITLVRERHRKAVQEVVQVPRLRFLSVGLKWNGRKFCTYIFIIEQ
jgi:uncharacterized protein (DUF486 family)